MEPVKEAESNKASGVETPMQLKLLATVDYVALVMLGVFGVGGLVLLIFGELTASRSLILLLGSLNVLGIWLVLLHFRCLIYLRSFWDYLVQIPAEAARIVLAYWQGGRGSK